MRVDVIVPVFRDNAALERLLAAPDGRRIPERMRVVFGEADPVGEALAERYGAAWSRAGRAGRACQMNCGAAKADGDVLLFLHADSLPPPGACAAIAAAVRDGAVGGAFSRRFDAHSVFLRGTCRLADWRGRALGIFLGDQGMFVRRDVFARLGGFDERARYEDLDLSLRLRKVGPVRLLPAVVRASGRRFTRRGVVRQTGADFRDGLRFILGRGRRSARDFRCVGGSGERPSRNNSPGGASKQ